MKQREIISQPHIYEEFPTSNVLLIATFSQELLCHAELNTFLKSFHSIWRQWNRVICPIWIPSYKLYSVKCSDLLRCRGHSQASLHLQQEYISEYIGNNEIIIDFTRILTYYVGHSSRRLWGFFWSDLINLNHVSGIESLKYNFLTK